MRLVKMLLMVLCGVFNTTHLLALSKISQHQFNILINSPHSFEPVVLTMPKTGSHLLLKLVELLTGQKSADGTEYQSNNQFYWTHSCGAKDFHHPKLKVLSIIRDPRDQLISYFFMHQRTDPTFFLNIDTDIIHYLDMYLPLYNVGIDDSYSPIRLRPNSQKDTFLINSNWGHYLKKMFCDQNVYITKFEKLVGPQGGGTREEQIEEIYNIAHHLGMDISNEKVDYIASHLFGNTRTFVAGQIGRWKQFFTQEHKKLFKHSDAGKLLIILGYERDNNW